MKIALIGPGLMPIPPNGWGAIESLIWDYYCNLKNNHETEIINNRNLKVVINYINSKDFDIVHIMYFLSHLWRVLCRISIDQQLRGGLKGDTNSMR